MSNVRGPRISAPEWAVLHDLRELLRSPGFVGVPPQGGGQGDAGDHRPISGESWAGQRLGVRAPEIGETPLSTAEVVYLFRGRVA